MDDPFADLPPLPYQLPMHNVDFSLQDPSYSLHPNSHYNNYSSISSPFASSSSTTKGSDAKMVCTMEDGSHGNDMFVDQNCPCPMTWSEVQPHPCCVPPYATSSGNEQSCDQTSASPPPPQDHNAPCQFGSLLPSLQYCAYTTQDFSVFPPLEGLSFVLQKELRNSDVNNIGRIVLPKRESEANLPFLSMKEGMQLTILDLHTSSPWRMRYRFWPNNKSRMYVLENTGDFIKHHVLKCGDFIALYQDKRKQLYIYSLKRETTPENLSQAQENEQTDVVSDEAQGGNEGGDNADMSGFLNLSPEGHDHNFGFDDLSCGSMFKDQSFEDCAISVYDMETERGKGLVFK